MYSSNDMGSAHLVAAALGRSLGVQVRVENVATACTDGKSILLPALPVNVPDQVGKMLWGFIHHEAGHCRHTDFGSFAEGSGKGDVVLAALINILEDIRMEQAHIKLYPGAHLVLCELVEALVDTEFFAPVEPDQSPADLVLGTILRHLRMTVLGQRALASQTVDFRRQLVGLLGETFTDKLISLAETVTDCSSTDDCVALATAVRSLLTDEQTQPPDDKSSDECSESGASNDDTGTGATNQDAQGDETAEGDDVSSDTPSPSSDPSQGDTSSDPCDQPSGPQGNNESDQETDDGIPSQGAGVPDPSDSQEDPVNADGSTASERSRFIERVLNESALDPSNGDLGEGLAQTLNDHIESTDDARVVLPTTHSRGKGYRVNQDVLAARSVSARLSSQLKRQLESRRRTPSVPKKSGRRLKRRRITRVAMNDYRIFEKRIINPAVNTSVLLLLDSSTSMSVTCKNRRSRIEVAREAVLASAIALDSIRNLSVCAASFPGNGKNDRVSVLSDFHESPESVSSRFLLPAKGYTPLAEALIWSSNHLAMCPRDHRKILVVATDGQPDRIEPTKQVVSSLERTGVEVYGLGIECNDSREIFSHWASVNDTNDLCNAYLNLFRHALRRTA